VIALDFRLGTGPERGDIVVARTPDDSSNFCPAPGGVVVMRLLGLPGELLEIRDAQLYVKNEPLEEPYLNHEEVGEPFGPSPCPRATTSCSETTAASRATAANTEPCRATTFSPR
jgi:hypothetical protein